MVQRESGKSIHPANRIVPEILDRMLAERGLNMADLQERSGISRSTLERAKRGEPLTARTLRKIGDTLDAIPVRTTVLRLLGQDSDARD